MLQARIALRFPWWTLKSSFAEIQKLAQLDGDAQQVQSSLDMQSSISKEGILQAWQQAGAQIKFAWMRRTSC